MDKVRNLADVTAPGVDLSSLPPHLTPLVVEGGAPADIMFAFRQLLVCLMSEVGFSLEEGQPKESPTSAAVRFSSLDGVGCDCALRITRAGPVLLVQGTFHPSPASILGPATFTTTGLIPSDHVLQNAAARGRVGERFADLCRLSRVFKDSVALPLAHHVRRALDMPEGAGSIGILPNELQARIVECLGDDRNSTKALSRTSRHWKEVCSVVSKRQVNKITERLDILQLCDVF